MGRGLKYSQPYPPIRALRSLSVTYSRPCPPIRAPRSLSVTYSRPYPPIRALRSLCRVDGVSAGFKGAGGGGEDAQDNCHEHHYDVLPDDGSSAVVGAGRRRVRATTPRGSRSRTPRGGNGGEGGRCVFSDLQRIFCLEFCVRGCVCSLYQFTAHLTPAILFVMVTCAARGSLSLSEWLSVCTQRYVLFFA